MDADRFDGIARTLGEGSSRRAALRLLAGGALGAALARFGWTDVAARDDAKDGSAETTARNRNKRRRGGGTGGGGRFVVSRRRRPLHRRP